MKSLRTILGLGCVLVVLVACRPSVEAPTPEALRLTVVSYNIHHGRGTDGRVDLDRIAKVLRALDPDIVALQEVDRGTQRTERIDEPTELARLTGMFATFGDNIDFQGGRYGNAVLSRWPPQRFQNHALPALTPGEQRGLMELEFAPPNRAAFTVLATHWDYRSDDAERQASVAMLETMLRTRTGAPLVLMGDLNALAESAVIERLGTIVEFATIPGEHLTFPAGEPNRHIDYIAFHPRGAFLVESTAVPAEPVASDHRPIVARLIFR